MQGGCFYREELYHIREKCKGVRGMFYLWIIKWDYGAYMAH